jgi:hypothetical protein
MHMQHFSLKLYQNSTVQYAIHFNIIHTKFMIYDTWHIEDIQ